MVAIHPNCLNCSKRLEFASVSDYHTEDMDEGERYCKPCGNGLQILELLKAHYGTDEAVDAISDALTDLYHACDVADLTLYDCQQQAYIQYTAEKEDAK